MRWNDNRVFLAGLLFECLFAVMVAITASTTFQALVGVFLGAIYLIFVGIFTEFVRGILLPDGMTLKEAGFGDKKYKYLDEVPGEGEAFK